MTNKLRLILVCLVLLSPIVYAKLTGSLSIEAISARLKPRAQVNIDGGSAADTLPTTESAAIGPKQIYDSNCKMCHQAGVAGAPRLGNKADWAPRLDQGLDKLVQNAWNGIRAMPPKGNCLQCTQEQIKETVQYMLDASK